VTSPSDRRGAVALLEAAQLVDALSFGSKQSVLRGRDSVNALRERVAAMKRPRTNSRSASSASTRYPWAELDAVVYEPNDLWKAAKRISPQLLEGLRAEEQEERREGARAATPRGRRRAPAGTG
jgi:hypothetical protein